MAFTDILWFVWTAIALFFAVPHMLYFAHSLDAGFSFLNSYVYPQYQDAAPFRGISTFPRFAGFFHFLCYSEHITPIYIHIFANSLALAFGCFQFNGLLRRQRTPMHRAMGKSVFACDCLFRLCVRICGRLLLLQEAPMWFV